MKFSFLTHVFITGFLVFVSGLCLLAVFSTTNKLRHCENDKSELENNIEDINNEKNELLKKIDSCETYSFIIEKPKNLEIVKPINPLPQKIVELATITSF